MAPDFQGTRIPDDDSALISAVTERILASHSNDVVDCSRCVSIAGLSSAEVSPGCAVLVGLSSEDCNWNAEDFIQSAGHLLGDAKEYLLPALNSECSLNSRFKSLVQGAPCFIGKASMALEQASATLGFYGLELGGTIGHVDCNIGGIGGSCSEIAACISYSSSKMSFQFTACGKDDIVTLNGVQIKSSMGSFAIESGDICSVGSRVFIFILPSS